MIEVWEKIGSEKIGDFRIFTVRKDLKISPRTKTEHDFFVIDCVNWVNVIAVTADNQMIMVEQYRHGSNTVELEIPGGMMDPEEISPEVTGARELREETGYEGQGARVIGRVFPNPAIMSNICYTALIENCQCLHPTEFDHSEDLVTRLVPVAEIPKLISSGKIQHSLVIAALYHYQLRRGA
jgi:8-oxo-dGTP pyrophosphatase MutT (NUDIX family)